MAVLRGSVPVWFGSRFLPVPRFVLEHLGLENAENLYSPARPRQCRRIQNMCCLCTARRNPTFVTSSEKQQAGLGVLGRGRGAVQVLEHLGPESAENLYSPRAPQAMQGNA